MPATFGNFSPSDLAEARSAVIEDRQILSGTPVFRGTRVPVRDVVASLDQGYSVEEVLMDYPSLDRRKVELAEIWWANADPAQKEPRRGAKPDPDTEVIRHRAARRERPC